MTCPRATACASTEARQLFFGIRAGVSIQFYLVAAVSRNPADRSHRIAITVWPALIVFARGQSLRPSRHPLPLRSTEEQISEEFVQVYCTTRPRSCYLSSIVEGFPSESLTSLAKRLHFALDLRQRESHHRSRPPGVSRNRRILNEIEDWRFRNCLPSVWFWSIG